MSDLLRKNIQAVSKIKTENYDVIPIAKSTRIQPPGFWGVFIWNRPKAVAIENNEGCQKIIPIPDYTRRAQAIILGIGLIGSLILWLFSKRSEPVSH